MKEARSPARPAGRLIPATEYLRSQRIRMMMMTKLAEATANVDVYIVASNNTGGGRGEGRGADGRGAEGRGAGGEPPRPQTPAQRHSTMANLACYPAINVPNGFADTGSPTNVTFFARPFGEMDLLALAKAYQDAAQFHTRRPPLDAKSTDAPAVRE
jgi:Asp-tRNA(Asn)/Glu-tRNA(Gln) amidotransferase A subunit family amidase